MINRLKIIFLNLYLPKILDESLSVDLFEVCVFDNVYNLHQNTSANHSTKVRNILYFMHEQSDELSLFERGVLSLSNIHLQNHI